MKRSFRSQLDFISIVTISAILGFGAGLFGAALVFLTAIQSGQLEQGILALLLTPIGSAAGTAFSAVLGFPFYYWYSNKIQGQKISGKFAEITENKEK
ncbi:hypothetical protein L1077_26955 [Pseudoalteromonas luteoviolacea]|uniref:hypothetical protein n=1 Tax=Pseudoalteromonas luteoviolacea TaxID=43657 RepID=UPI001F1E2A0E|nr:hypothetical protein [Pseudoalteromonas luteoviolacea]MCF6443070.1 hypothetical protein [Pseudoalteromonas luteoviolacea]